MITVLKIVADARIFFAAQGQQAGAVGAALAAAAAICCSCADGGHRTSRLCEYLAAGELRFVRFFLLTAAH